MMVIIEVMVMVMIMIMLIMLQIDMIIMLRRTERLRPKSWQSRIFRPRW